MLVLVELRHQMPNKFELSDNTKITYDLGFDVAANLRVGQLLFKVQNDGGQVVDKMSVYFRLR